VQKKYPPPCESKQPIIYDKSLFLDKFPFKADISKPNVCSCPWKSPVISWNGDVTLCTSDSEMELVVGNVNKESFSKIWWENDNLSNYRNIMISAQDKLKMKCKNCLIPQSSNYATISDDEILYYLKRKHREDLISGKTLKDVIILDPFVFSDSHGEIGFYQGEDGFKDGYSFIFVKGGFLEYEFKGKAKKIEMNIASLDWKNGKKTEVEIILNGKIISKQMVEPMGKGNGKIYSFPVKSSIEENVLRINSKELAIFYKPLKKGLLETPIKVYLN
jgi:radical SAM protein with 4Fe4S-binding SPASM domain